MSQSVNRELWKGLMQEWLTASGYFASDRTAVDAAEVECKPDTFVRCNMEMGTIFAKNIYIYLFIYIYIYV
jgi:hypothetical protein